MDRYEEIIEETAKYVCEEIVEETWPLDKDRQSFYRREAEKLLKKVGVPYAIYLRTGK